MPRALQVGLSVRGRTESTGAHDFFVLRVSPHPCPEEPRVRARTRRTVRSLPLLTNSGAEEATRDGTPDALHGSGSATSAAPRSSLDSRTRSVTSPDAVFIELKDPHAGSTL